MALTQDKYLGTGIGFPLFLENGSAKLLQGKELIRLSIFNILAWYWGRKYMQGQFGSNIERFIEAPLDYITVDIIRTRVIEALSNYEKRIQLQTINPIIDNDKLYIHIRYRVILDNTTDTFIIPFYTIINQ